MEIFSTPRWKDGWYVLPWEVIWRDLDSVGHVNNAVYFTYFEMGRTRYWLDLRGGEKALDIEFIVARAECDFVRQLSLGQRIEIATRIGEIRNSSFDFQTEVRCEDGVAAKGRVVAVHFSWHENRKRPLPDELRKRIEDFQKQEV
ncbi:MAG TPA: thioesterase family protein [Thermoanaerobaculia bacterium]|nr:thioesterase family protein [Thermoanaerobaculia bacterium]